MVIPRSMLTLRRLFVLVAVAAAYFAGLVSDRSALNDAWGQLRCARDEIAHERERTEIANAIARIPIEDTRSLQKVNNLLDRLEASEMRRAQPLPSVRTPRLLPWQGPARDPLNVPRHPS